MLSRAARPKSDHLPTQYSSSASSEDEPPLPIGRYLFYCTSGTSQGTRLLLPPGYELGMWWPSLRHPWPRGAFARAKLRFLFRTLVQIAGSYSDGDWGAVCLHFGGRLIHYSGFTPRYYRFPFLPDQDLQIGHTWTDPAHRGRGLASIALRQILVMKSKPGRKFWYVVEAVNRPSIKVAEKAGFRVLAQGSQVRPLGIKLLGAYVIAEYPLGATTLAQKPG